MIQFHEDELMCSTGVLSGKEYEELVSYCKENKLETLHFFLDLIDCYTESAKAGTRQDNCVDHFLCVLNEMFPDTLCSDNYIWFKRIQEM